MAIGFNPNRRAGSKAVWTVLLTIERPVSWSVLVPGTVTPQIPKVNFFFFFFFSYWASLSLQSPSYAYRAHDHTSYSCDHTSWAPIVGPVARALHSVTRTAPSLFRALARVPRPVVRASLVCGSQHHHKKLCRDIKPSVTKGMSYPWDNSVTAQKCSLSRQSSFWPCGPVSRHEGPVTTQSQKALSPVHLSRTRKPC